MKVWIQRTPNPFKTKKVYVNKPNKNGYWFDAICQTCKKWWWVFAGKEHPKDGYGYFNADCPKCFKAKLGAKQR